MDIKYAVIFGKGIALDYSTSRSVLESIDSNY